MARKILFCVMLVLNLFLAGGLLAQEAQPKENLLLPGTRPLQSLEPTAEYRERIQELLKSTPLPMDDGTKSEVMTPVYGRFGYYRDDGVYVGANKAKVTIYKQGYISLMPPLEPVEVATLETDEEGYFTAYPFWDCTNGPFAWSKLVIKFETVSLYGRNPVTIYSDPYSWSLIWESASCSGPWDIGVIAPMGESDYPKVHLFNLATYARNIALNEFGLTFLDIEIRYPYEPVPHFFSEQVGFSTQSYIYISGDDAWDEGVLFHGIGHAIDAEVGQVEDYDLCNGLCDPEVDLCSFCDWCEEDMTAAWNEGFASFMADVFIRRYDAEPGTENVDQRDFELLQWCGSGGYDSAHRTPGFTAALLRDMVDPIDPADDHALYPGYADAYAADITTILDVLEWNSIETTFDFLDTYAWNNPSGRSALWETAFNCGFDIDSELPEAVTNLTSSSHAIGSSSTDRTVDFSWTAAYDDMSGIEGYAVIITGINGMPYGELAIGDVTSYTSAPLDPGTYFFNIRAKDFSGNWSNAYNYYGPFTIISNDDVDLAYVLRNNWDDLSFPSQGSSNSVSEAHLTPVLDGNINGNHWNLGGQNQGSTATGGAFYAQAFIDNVYQSQGSWGSINPGVMIYAADAGNFTVPGGRHCFHTKLDGHETIGETDETNNIHGKQYIWTGLPLTPGNVVTRSAPSLINDGWENMSNTTWYNADGLSFSSEAWWSVVAVRAQSDLDNYSCRLHAGSTGSTDGFAGNVAFSTRPAGALDGVIVNRNTMGNSAWDVGVVNPWGAVSDYKAELQGAITTAFGDSLAVTMAAGQHILLREVYVSTSNVGNVHVSLRAGEGSETITMSWLDKGFQTGTLLDNEATAQTDAEGFADLSLDIPEVGYYCLVIYRDSYTELPSRELTLEIQRTPPDPQPLFASGWHSPLVPRSDTEATVDLVALPDTLYGSHVGPTYFNYALFNDSPTPADGLFFRIEVDGVGALVTTLNNFPAYYEMRGTSRLPIQVRGGRHTVSSHSDPNQVMEEIDETNNTYGEQYVWTPVTVANGTGVTRQAPPNPVGGWAIASANWFNCDGLRMANPSHYWQAAALMPTQVEDNPDIRLHAESTGSQSGFQSSLAVSQWASGSLDYVLVNYNQIPYGSFDLGVIPGSGGAVSPYRLEVAQSVGMGEASNGTFGPVVMGGDEIIDLYEWEFAPGFYRITLHNEAGGVDWGLSLHGADEGFQSKSTTIDGGASWLAAGGDDESIEFNRDYSDYLCLAVWKVGTADLAQEGQYSLSITYGLTPVGENQLPQATRLVGAVPNPFNPMTTIAYELEREAQVELVVFDLTGAVVKTLVQGTENGGWHSAQWRGQDTAGRVVASGTYLVRLKVDDIPVGASKLLLVR
jgi:FlgD Ig-like domain